MVKSSRSGRMVYSAVLATLTVMGSNPEPQQMLVDTSADRKGSANMLTCTGVTPEVNLRIKGEKACSGSTLAWQTSPKVQNRDAVAPRKRLMSSKKIKKNKKEKKELWFQILMHCFK